MSYIHNLRTPDTAPNDCANPKLGAAAPARSNPDFAALVSSLESQQAELAALREQLKLRDEALDAVSTHFAITRNSKDDRIIEYCNRALAEHHGFTREALIGSSASSLRPENSRTPAYDEIVRAILAGEVVRFEEVLERQDGTHTVVGVSVVPIRVGEQGRATYSLSMAADITARREAEQREKALQEQLVAEMKKRESILLELRLAQKLESVGRLAAGVAHEINTPIQYVGDSLYFLRNAFDDLVGLINTCKAKLDENPTEHSIAIKQRLLEASEAIDLNFVLAEVPKAFARTFEGVARVASIVRSMKEFSYPDATEFSAADINHAWQSTLTVASNEYKYIAKVITEFDPKLPPVMCNIGELNQVFLNLIVNAAHAIHDSGKDVSQGEIRVTTAQAGDHIEIKVIDNGCGIPKEHLDKIYDPFFTTKEVGRGTGQGLAITHSVLVDKHGGSVQVNSEVGKGTTFVIRLPVAGNSDGNGEGEMS